MNLGQLIDATWVQDGKRERFAPQRQAEETTATTVTRMPGRPLSPTVRAILENLAASGRPLMCRAIRALLGEEAPSTEEVSAYLSQLIVRGCVEKLGTEPPFTYRITELGRERLR